MSRVFVLPYKMGSEGAAALAAKLGCNRLYNDSRSKYRYRTGDVIINWGNSQLIPLYPSTRWMRSQAYPKVLNRPECVRKATNKLLAFQAFTASGVPTCEWTTNLMDWAGQSVRVFARKHLTGKCGSGIHIIDNLTEDEWVSAPLYTKHFNSKREYRVHVVRGSVIDYVKKGKRRDREEDPDPLIRNHENGWVFIRDGVDLPDEVAEAAIKAVSALGLDFGAVDVGYNSRLEQRVCVYEINCAPGYEAGTITARSYARAFQSLAFLGGGA